MTKGARRPKDDGPPPDRNYAVPWFLKLTIGVIVLWGIYYMATNFRPYPGYLTAFHPHPGKITGTPVERGKYDFQTVGCMSCHTVGPYGGTLGPNLTHVASTGVTATFLHAWLSNPAKTMPGATMPRLPLSQRQIDDLTAYLLTLR